MRTRPVLAVAPPAAIALALAALAAPSSAATVATLPCIPTVLGTSDPTVPITGAGFTPNARITIAYTQKQGEPRTATSVTADAAGAFSTVAYPATYTSYKTQEQTFGIIAADKTNPAAPILATTTFKQVRGGFNISPNPSKPTSKVTYTARGWPVGKTIYAHFRFAGKTRRDVKLGVAKGPCGIAKLKMRALPTKARFGKWTVYVDQVAKFDNKTVPQVKDSFTIFRRFF